MNLIKFIFNYLKRWKIPSKKEITEYYPKYLLAHKNPINKILHIFGNFLTIIFISLILYFSQIYLFLLVFLLLTPFVVYLGAWPGHFLFEKNQPATFKANPVLTKTCDWIMIFQIFIGRINLDTRNRGIEE